MIEEVFVRDEASGTILIKYSVDDIYGIDPFDTIQEAEKFINDQIQMGVEQLKCQ